MTGRPWDEVREQMDFPRYLALKKFWKVIPPLAHTAAKLAVYFGVHKPETPRPEPGDARQNNPKDIEQLLSLGRGF